LPKKREHAVKITEFPWTPTWGESFLTEKPFPALVVKGEFGSSVVVSSGILNF
jgi:hypothetical protein